MNVVKEMDNQQNPEESKSENQNTSQSSIPEKTSSEIWKAKMIFCALMETGLIVRNEFFDTDLMQLANTSAINIAEGGAKNISDKKYVARNTYKLMQQVQQMRSDKVLLEGRVNVLVTKTLAQVPEEERKQYPEIMEYMKELIKNRN